jgi:hypothetical protein
MMVDNTGIGRGDFFSDSAEDVASTCQQQSSGNIDILYLVNLQVIATNSDTDGGGEFIVKGVAPTQPPYKQFALEYKNNALSRDWFHRSATF